MTSITPALGSLPQKETQARSNTGVGYGAIITMGFAIVVAMWAIGFVSRIPIGGGASDRNVFVPSWLVGILLAAVVGVGGYLGRRWSAGSVWTGAQIGFAAGLVNLLIIAGVIMKPSFGQTVLASAIWIPGSILATMLLATIGSAFAANTPATSATSVNWLGMFAKVTAAATFVLLMVGGAVTAQDAGLAVVDWPNTEGYLMWAYPLAKMTGGIYYEHAHRLFGSLVGLCTVVLAIYITLRDNRSWMKWVAWSAVILVIGQGILGGLRVTGHLTLSTSAADTAPNLILAIVHGVLGQIFFSVTVALWVFTSQRWQENSKASPVDGAGTDQKLTLLLYGSLVLQLVLGALVRHLMSDAYHVEAGNVTTLLSLHIVLAMIVSLLAVAVGSRGWGIYLAIPPLGLLGTVLLGLITWQLLLGCLAYVSVFLGDPQPRPATGFDAITTTLHQSTGALLLGTTMMMVLWSRQLLKKVEQTTD